jgi:hypothetical protein
MELPIDVLEKINAFVEQLDEEKPHLTFRQQAIAEAARLLIYLTHDEYYNSTDIPSTKYLDIAEKCTDFVLRKF